MKKFLAILTACAAAFSMCACTQSKEEDEQNINSSEASLSSCEDSQDFSSIESCKINDENFSVYTSNTCLSTGNNGMIKSAENITYRAYIPIEQYGSLEYCFYFSNSVDSTYNSGDTAFVGKQGGEYTISHAAVYDGGTSLDDPVTSMQEITFSGGSEKSVSSGETFWSDPVTVNIPENHYLVWEWTVSGKDIPCTNMSNLTSTTADESGEGEFVYCNEVPLPVFIGAKRENVTNKITAIGDSITQGCQTEYMKYEFWAAQISSQLDENSSFWNCGLGWARASDASSCGNWLGRALNCDTLIVAFGTNDIISGEYGGDGGNSPEEIIAYLEDILAQAKACEVKNIILFNAPPQNYKQELEQVRVQYNELLKQTAQDYGAYYFDFASYLCDPETPDIAKYGGHPNGEAGKIVADAFMETYKNII